mmetsp:Transcript_2537/g.9297  ORF Transcript_2537/g.9297 Transcript_2537/m.9297 type:complete len:234 (+) Transcript_2537:351-1052(+)
MGVWFTGTLRRRCASTRRSSSRVGRVRLWCCIRRMGASGTTRPTRRGPATGARRRRLRGSGASSLTASLRGSATSSTAPRLRTTRSRFSRTGTFSSSSFGGARWRIATRAASRPTATAPDIPSTTWTRAASTTASSSTRQTAKSCGNGIPWTTWCRTSTPASPTLGARTSTPSCLTPTTTSLAISTGPASRPPPPFRSRTSTRSRTSPSSTTSRWGATCTTRFTSSTTQRRRR